MAAVFGGQWKNPATGTEIQTGCENQSCCSIDAEFVQFLLQISHPGNGMPLHEVDVLLAECGEWLRQQLTLQIPKIHLLHGVNNQIVLLLFLIEVWVCFAGILGKINYIIII